MRNIFVVLALCMTAITASSRTGLDIFNSQAYKKSVAKPASQKTWKGFNYNKVLEKFHNLSNPDNCGIMQQVKGYEWVFMSESEVKQEELSSRTITYDYYPSHPEFRRQGVYLYNNEGKLKAVVLLTDCYNDNLDYTNVMYPILTKLTYTLMVRAYKDGDCDVNNATTEQRMKIENYLGLRRPAENESKDYDEIAGNYWNKLKKYAEDQLYKVSKVTRIDSTSFTVQYADVEGKPTIPVTMRFYPYRSPFNTIYTYDYPLREDEQPVTRMMVSEIKGPSAQDNKNKQNLENKIFDVVERQPSFPGGQMALIQWLSQYLRYPVSAQEKGIQGKVLVQFVVRKDGSIGNAKIYKSVNPDLDKEALFVVNSMPRWSPGMQNGEPVNARYTLPIVFSLQ